MEATPGKSSIADAGIPIALQESAHRGGLAWRQLGLRLCSITPAGLARALLVIGLFSVIFWLVGRAGAALTPFWVGLALAYATLPFVNWLDRFMPRIAAVLLLLALELLVLSLILAVVLPILATELIQLGQSLPDAARLQRWLDELVTYLKTLPPTVQDFLDGWLRNAYHTAKLNFTTYLVQLVGAGVFTAFGVARSLTFLLSFLIIPTWLVSALRDQRQVRASLDNAMPPGMRLDFWAVVRIVDRTFNALITARFAFALLVAVLTYAGFRALSSLTAFDVPFPAVLALIGGVFQLIPIVGALVGVSLLAVLTLSVSWKLALAVVVLYILVGQVVRAIVEPWLGRKAVNIHPAILAPVVVLGSMFGFAGAVLAGPLTVVTRDLFRYVYGRLSEPPRPAGLIPGEEPAEPVSAGRMLLRRPRRLAADRKTA